MIASLETEIAQRRMIVGTAAKRPMVLTITLVDPCVVDASDAQPHQAVLVEFPILVAVAAEPVTAFVVPFIGKADGDAVIPGGPDFFDQPVVELAVPFARQKRFDGLAALDKLRAVPPATVACVSERDPSRITRIPCVFCHAHFLGGGLVGEGWKGA